MCACVYVCVWRGEGGWSVILQIGSCSAWQATTAPWKSWKKQTASGRNHCNLHQTRSCMHPTCCFLVDSHSTTYFTLHQPTDFMPHQTTSCVLHQTTSCMLHTDNAVLQRVSFMFSFQMAQMDQFQLHSLRLFIKTQSMLFQTQQHCNDKCQVLVYP